MTLDDRIQNTPTDPNDLPAPLVAKRVTRRQYGDGEPEVSVVTLDFHDREDWFAECLASVKAQTGLDAWEHIVLDNHGNAVGPVGEAKDRAIGFARAPWVFILDDDDKIAEDCLAKLLDLGKRGADYVQCQATLIDARGEPWGTTISTLGLIDAAFYDETGGFEAMNRLSDVEWLRRLPDDVTRGYVDEPLYRYRLHRDQTSASVAEKREMYEFIEDQGGVV